jgi:hypothetical protein
MDNKFRDILDSLPEPGPRSGLDPFRELIDELHRRDRTYREIAQILAERCNISASVSTVYRFLHRQSRIKPQPRKCHSPSDSKLTKSNQTAIPEEVKKATSINSQIIPPLDETQRRIAALKLRPATTQTNSQLFNYDPDEPLRLLSKTIKNK